MMTRFGLCEHGGLKKPGMALVKIVGTEYDFTGG
jgi:hypothetical protein